jgi:arabinofuranosyltransferase
MAALRKDIPTGASLAFVLWSATFIFKSSFVAIDGHRYFCLFDDAMISMRYAWNFSHGVGLVWNAGERVQGYSNLLMVLVMAVATSISTKPVAPLLIQLLGIVTMIAIGTVAMRIADHLSSRQVPSRRVLIRTLSFLFALSYYPLNYWSLMGMETGLVTLLLLSAILAAFTYVLRRRSASLWWMSSCLGLAYLT